MNSNSIEKAKTAVRQGDYDTARQLFGEVVQRTPDDPEGWLWLAAVSETREARLACLNRVIALEPQHALAQKALYETMQAHLEQDAFLAYIRETDHVYQVHTADETPILVPKSRAVPEAYPPPETAPQPLRSTYCLLRLAVVGLLPAGLGTLIFAPPAAVAALLVWRRPLSIEAKRRSQGLFVLAISLWLAGILLAFLFFLHVG